jgi:hypothetical protein
VYCGTVLESDALTLDHVQPRARGGDRSAGNIVTACIACNARKGHASIARFLAGDPIARANFFRYAVHVWRRHLRAIEDELASLDRRAGRRGSASSG